MHNILDTEALKKQFYHTAKERCKSLGGDLKIKLDEITSDQISNDCVEHYGRDGKKIGQTRNGKHELDISIYP